MCWSRKGTPQHPGERGCSSLSPQGLSLGQWPFEPVNIVFLESSQRVAQLTLDSVPQHPLFSLLFHIVFLFHPQISVCVCGGGRKSLLKLCKQRGGCFAKGCKTHLLQKCKERHNDGVPSWKSRPFPGEKQSTEMKSSSRPSLT